MSDSDGSDNPTPWGLIVAIVSASLVLAYLVWVYTSPREPHISAREAQSAPSGQYHPGGASCAPEALARLTGRKRVSESDRCAQAAEDHRAQQQQIAEAIRANDVAERNLGLAFRQARSSAIQAVATALAFIAAGVAAVVAWRAAVWAKEAAKYTAAGAREAKRSADIAETSDRPHLILSEIALDNVTIPAPGEEMAPAKLRHQFVNLGQSVAWVTSAAFAFSAPEEGLNPGYPTTEASYYWPVPPTERWGTLNEGFGVPIDLATRQQILSGQRAAFIVGKLVYQDARGTEHSFEFVYQFEPKNMRLVPWPKPERWKYT